MLVFSPATYAINAAPYASLGRQVVGQENAELKATSFPPAQQLEQAAHSLNRRSLDEQRNLEIERDRLIRYRATIVHDHAHAESSEDPISGEAGLSSFLSQAAFERQQLTDMARFHRAADSVDQVKEGISASIPSFQLQEERERQAKEAQSSRLRQEIMGLVARRSIQLNQRLLEIALSPNEMGVGEILNYRA